MLDLILEFSLTDLLSVDEYSGWAVVDAFSSFKAYFQLLDRGVRLET